MRSLSLAMAIMLTAGSAQAQTGKIAPQFGWLANFDQAKAAAKKSGKPIFLVFRCEP